MPDQKYSVEELGRRVRAKGGSELSGYSDRQIGERVLQRNPSLGNLIDTSIVEDSGKSPNAEQSPGGISFLNTKPQEQTVPKEGLLKSIAKSVAKPFAETATAGYNTLAATGKLLTGDVQGANQALESKRDLPFMGQTKPSFTGQESFGEGVKKMAGYGAEMAMTLAPVGEVGVGAKALVKGAGRIGLQSAVGDVGRQIEQTGTVNPGEVARSAVTGALVPVGIAKFVGSNGKNIVKGAINSKAEKALQDVVEMSKPVLNKAETASAVAKGAGREAGLFRPAKVAPTARDIERAQAIARVVDPKAGNIVNVGKLRTAIKDEADQLIAGLQNNNAIFNQNQLGARLNAIELPISVKADPLLSRYYDLAKKSFMKFVSENPKNMTGLLKARQQFDDLIEREIPKVFDNPGARPFNDALRRMRTEANDFIASKLPSDGASEAFKASLKKQNLMFEAVDNMAERAAKQDVGKSGLEKFIGKHPVAKEALKYGTGAVVGGGLINSMISGNGK